MCFFAFIGEYFYSLRPHLICWPKVKFWRSCVFSPSHNGNEVALRTVFFKKPLFWWLTCCSVTFSNLAISVRSEDDKYFLFSNIFSSSNICRPVKVVRTFFFLFSWSSLSSIFRLIPHLRSVTITKYLVHFTEYYQRYVCTYSGRHSRMDFYT